MNKENSKDLKKCSSCNITEKYVEIKEVDEEGSLLCEPCKLGEEIEDKETELRRLVERQRTLFWRIRKKLNFEKFKSKCFSEEIDRHVKLITEQEQRIKDLEQKLKEYE